MLGVDGSGDFVELRFVVRFAGHFQYFAGLANSLFLDQPARAARNGEKHHKEVGCGNGGYTQVPSPFIGPHVLKRDYVVREVCNQNSEDDVELKEADQTSTPTGGRDFGNVHGTENGRPSDPQPAYEAKDDEGCPVPRARAAY